MKPWTGPRMHLCSFICLFVRSSVSSPFVISGEVGISEITQGSFFHYCCAHALGSFILCLSRLLSLYLLGCSFVFVCSLFVFGVPNMLHWSLVLRPTRHHWQHTSAYLGCPRAALASKSRLSEINFENFQLAIVKEFAHFVQVSCDVVVVQGHFLEL